MMIADGRPYQFTKADFKDAGGWLLASLVFPLAYLRWYRLNQGRVGAIFPVLLVGVTAGILGLIYLNFRVMFQTAPALVLLWLFGSFLTLLFLATRPGDYIRRLGRDRAVKAALGAALLLFALALDLTLGLLSRVAHGAVFTGIGVALYSLVVLWALVGAYLIFRLPDDALARGPVP